MHPRMGVDAVVSSGRQQGSSIKFQPKWPQKGGGREAKLWMGRVLKGRARHCTGSAAQAMLTAAPATLAGQAGLPCPSSSHAD